MIEVTYIEHMGSDVSVVNAARVSFGKKTTLTYTLPEDDKLIKYLAKHRHMSPFGHCFVSFHIKAPIFVARQLVKHKFLRWNEISRRYVDDEPEFYTPDNWREKANNKKQGSGDGFVNKIMCSDKDMYPPDKTYLADFWEVEVSDIVNDEVYGPCHSRYNELINIGVCPAQARMVLPQSSMTAGYWSGSLDAFSDMCKLRTASDTQGETRDVAQKISYRMGKLFPVSWKALMDTMEEI